MKRLPVLLMAAALVIPAFAQETTVSGAEQALARAEARLQLAAMAGARSYASALYDEARMRVDYARTNLSSSNNETRNAAIRAAVEGWRAAEAAEAKAKWLSSTDQIRTLRAEIERLGGSVPAMMLVDEPSVTIQRSEESSARIADAEAALSRAKALDAERFIGEDLFYAEDILDSARGIARRQKQSTTANHLAYIAEMIGRRGEYLARLDTVSDVVPELRTERAELLQADLDRRAEQMQRERYESERRAAELREQLARERSQRAAEGEELARLRRQLREQQEIFAATLSADRTARLTAARRLDDLRLQYEAALSDSANRDAGEIERLRQQVEEQQLRLAQLRSREIQSERALMNELDLLRSELQRERASGNVSEEVVRERERFITAQSEEIERLRQERVQEEQNRQRVREEYERRVAASESRLREVQLEAERLESAVALERERAEEAERQLAAMRAEMERRETETARLAEERAARLRAMEARLSELAETRREERGFIVTLPGLYFDTGRATLKQGVRANLQKIAELVEEVPEAVIVVEGHTDSVGSEASNQNLSERRAVAVKDFLVREGVSPLAITTVGRGENQPIASNDTASGRAQNRRVELVISMRDAGQTQ
ncbi:MAG: OmpA family protein [Acidobacteria bacterium]|nr:OmpA family protein [Acidobacteriota bacterium]